MLLPNTISVIVPVYNATKTLERCVSSILAQTYRPLDIILIDDGSTDSSLLLCQQLARQHQEIRVIHTENQGQGSARNTGLNLVQEEGGTYVGFVDADDEIESDMYSSLFEQISLSNADMAACGHNDVVAGKLIKRNSNVSGTLNKTQALELFLQGKYLKWNVWDKLFRVNSIGNLRMTNKKIHAEDAMFVLRFIQHNNIFSYEDSGKYHYYRDNQASFTKQKWGLQNLGLTQFYAQLYQTAQKYHIDSILPSVQARYYENLLSTFVRCNNYGYPNIAKRVLINIKKERSFLMSSQLKLFYKIDLWLCLHFPSIAIKLNRWYR